jgi:hypothetical protein
MKARFVRFVSFADQNYWHPRCRMLRSPPLRQCLFHARLELRNQPLRIVKELARK